MATRTHDSRASRCGHPPSWTGARVAFSNGNSRIGGVVERQLSACRAAEPPRAPSADAIDDFGTRIAIGKPPSRIVSLNPTTTEILFAIGAGKRLVGRSQYDTFPDSAKTVPSLGAALRPSVEAIVAANPDLVVLYASEDNRPAFDRLRQAGIPTVAFKLDSIEQFGATRGCSGGSPATRRRPTRS